MGTLTRVYNTTLEDESTWLGTPPICLSSSKKGETAEIQLVSQIQYIFVTFMQVIIATLKMIYGFITYGAALVGIYFASAYGGNFLWIALIGLAPGIGGLLYSNLIFIIFYFIFLFFYFFIIFT